MTEIDLPTVMSAVSAVTTVFVTVMMNKVRIEILQLKIWIMNEFEPRRKVLTRSEDAGKVGS